MLDLNKLRSEFENLPEIAEILNEEKSHFNGDFYDLPFNSCAESFINGAWFGWQEKAKAQAVPENHIVVPRTREVVVAIEKIVQQQCDASGVQEPLHRLDGWRILEEIAEKVEEIK
ncbi:MULTISPECIES: hypothetical protein [unclassified Acinetobacter]|uniref:hypothetical protein n=1 Tax=unclassified Acinetobacter TaxID=196816 RepID=UPI0022EA4D07|nr:MULTISPECIES: hypothetical protein [unclassified Acinetobacter]MDA3449324.1 hypothetical protein [Acinetobacter sp. AOR40_HL]MDA3456168.1 hypothetical protein [Acinetobacter sp. AOR39_HL]